MYNAIDMLRELAFELEGEHESHGFLNPANGPNKASEVLWSAADYLASGAHFTSYNSVFNLIGV